MVDPGPPTPLSPAVDGRKRGARQRHILRVTIGYGIIAALWILLSDALLAPLFDPMAIQWLSTVKGLLFVMVTTLLLFFAMRAVPDRPGAVSINPEMPPSGVAAPWPGVWVYLFAVTATLATLLLRFAIPVPFVERPMMVLFLFPIIISAMAGGLGPGLAATLTAALAVNYFTTSPLHSLMISNPIDLFQWSFLVANGVLVSALSEVLHRQRRQSEADRQLQAVTLASIGDGVITTDNVGRVTFLNPEAERLTYWPGREALGRPLVEVFRVINEQTRQPLADPVQLVLDSGARIGLDSQALLLTRDGRELPIYDSCAPIRLADNTLLGVALVFRDDTQRRQAEALVLEERALYQDLVNAQSAGIYRILVRTGRHWSRYSSENPGEVPYSFEATSDRFCEILGVNRRELAEDPGLIGRLIHPDDAAGFTRANSQANLDITPFLWEGRMFKGSEVLWVHLESLPRQLANGDILWTGILTDISERKALEGQLLQAQKMEFVGRLAGGVAHDFNNMLTVIGGHAELAIGQTPPDDPRYLDLQEIQSAARRSANLTRQLLAFARKQTVSPVVLDLNDTLAAMLKMLQRLIGEGINLAWLPGHDLWRVKIDPSQIDQLLANLAVNARDAIAGVGKVTIETANHRLDQEYCATHPDITPGDYVELAVTDSGCGMDEEVKAHLFEPFFTTKKEGEGTGLGLATVYGIVKQNRGTINVYSEPGKGTTFRIYLPRHEEPADVTMDSPPSPPAPGGSETLLIVEDDLSILLLGKRFMEKVGYRVLTATSPSEALRLAEGYAGVIDLLITDVVMPEMNGKQLAARLKEIRPGLKCLFMSGYTADAIARQGVLDEGICFLAKPFSSGEMAAKVREALG